ncbi:MAG: hypothetical protein IJL87_07250 [Clostridia bacterium]|nr:hypothetical protein [Clostridia bacterium]
MKKSYIKPEIKVESAKLAAFCSAPCTWFPDLLPPDMIEALTAEGNCYCYHGTAGADFVVYDS